MGMCVAYVHCVYLCGLYENVLCIWIYLGIMRVACMHIACIYGCMCDVCMHMVCVICCVLCVVYTFGIYVGCICDMYVYEVCDMYILYVVFCVLCIHVVFMWVYM